MPKYILITDPNGANRVVPESAKAFVIKQNDAWKEEERLKIGQTFEDEETANEYVIKNPMVVGHSPIKKVEVLNNALQSKNAELKAKDDEIATLKALLTKKA